MKPFKALQVNSKPSDHKDGYDKLIKKFQKSVRGSGVLQELYDRRFYMKPSAERRFEKNNQKKKQE